MISSVTGRWLDEAQARDPEYWVQQVRACVDFCGAVKTLKTDTAGVALELGPNDTLATLAALNAMDAERVVRTDSRSLYGRPGCLIGQALASLWSSGCDIDWEAYHSGSRRQKVPLPTYPFQRRRHWLDVSAEEPPAPERRSIERWAYEPVWKQKNLHAGRENACSASDMWLLFADRTRIGQALLDALDSRQQPYIVIASGDVYLRECESRYIIRPDSELDYRLLLADIGDRECSSIQIVHAWGVGEEQRRGSVAVDGPESSSRLQWEYLRRGIYSLFYLSQALEVRKKGTPVQLLVLSTEVHRVLGKERLCPEKAAVLGVCKVLPQEIKHFNCASVDIETAQLEVPERIAGRILAELAAALPDSSVALRGDRRWVPDFQAVEFPRSASKSGGIAASSADTVLITGGWAASAWNLPEHTLELASAG